MVGGGVQWHGRAPLSGVVEAVFPARCPGVATVATEDHEAAQETEGGAYPTGVQREAEGHEAFVLVSANGEPNGRYDATQSHEDHEGAADPRAAQFNGGGVVVQTDAGHGHEDEQQSRKTQQTGADHQSPRRLDVGGQRQDLVQGHAVVQRRGDDALGPQAPGAQLIHPDAGRHGVVAGPDPVVGGGGDDDADPARTAGRAAGDLPAHVRHGEAPCVITRTVDPTEGVYVEVYPRGG